MKIFFSLAFLLVSAVVFSQSSLKDALYSGKLRLDTGTVIRKGEDLSSRIDTSTKKPVVADTEKKLPVARDSAVTEQRLVLDSAGGVVVVSGLEELQLPKPQSKAPAAKNVRVNFFIVFVCLG